MRDSGTVPARLVAALCAALLSFGCTTTHREIRFDAEQPAVRVSRQGVLFGDTFVRPQDVPEILCDYGVPRERTIHIRLDPDVRDLGPARLLMGCLCRAGYNSPVLVTERHAESVNLGRRKPPAPARVEKAPPRRVRYKRADE